MSAWSNYHLAEVYRRLAQADVEHVVVGGQAANLWAEHYRVAGVFPEHVWRNLLPFTSSDLDLFGGSVDAIRAGEAFGVEAMVYDPFAKSSSPNSGTLFIPLGEDAAMGSTNADLMVHFLHRVHGLNSDDVRANALLVDCFGGQVRVLHPLLCLEAKLSNLQDFDQERPPRQDLKHARICALAVRAFAGERMMAGHIREGLEIIERVMRLAERQSGLIAWYAHGLCLEETVPGDILEAIADNEPKITNFLTLRWEQLQVKLADRRAHFGAVAQRQGSEPQQIDPLLPLPARRTKVRR